MLKSLRIQQAVQRGTPVEFVFDECSTQGYEGESVAAALFAAGIRTLRTSPRNGLPRGMFCLMGSCQECLVWIGARKLAACQVPVAAGLEVETLAHHEQRQEHRVD